MALRIKRYRKKYPAASAAKVAIDCGGVLSERGDVKHDGATIYRAAAENAYLFVHLLHHRTGDYPHVVSRVNNPSPTHWVVRFCEAMGIPRDHIHLVQDAKEKDRHTTGCTCVVDDSWNALRAMGAGAGGDLVEGFWWQNHTDFLPSGRHPYDEWMQRKVRCLADFWTLARELRLQCTHAAHAVFARGPPNGPHSAALVAEAVAALNPLRPGGGEDDDEQGAEPPAGHDDVDYDEEEPAAPETVAVAAAATAAPAAASAAEVWASAPASVKGQPEVAATTAPKSAALKLAAKSAAWKLPPPAGGQADAAPEAATVSSSKPGAGGAAAVAKELAEALAASEGGNSAAASAAKKLSAALASSAAASAAEPAGLPLQKVGGGDGGDMSSSKSSRSSSKTSKTKTSETHLHSESRSETDASGRGDHKRSRRLELQPSSAQREKDKGRSSGSGGIRLKENPTRVATQQDLQDAVNEIAAKVTQQVLSTMASSSSAAPSAAPRTPDPPPHWYSGGRYRNPESGWVARKQQRAREAYERKQMGQDKKPAITPVILCADCGRNQPGSRCFRQLCRSCCKDRRCEQHGW